MSGIDSLVVNVDPIAESQSPDDGGQTCLKVTVKNVGEQIVVIARATIRICVKKQVGRFRIRWCVPFSTQVSFEIGAGTCLPLTLPAGEQVVFNVCTGIRGDEKEKAQAVDSGGTELDIYELHDGVEFVRTLEIDGTIENCRQ